MRHRYSAIAALLTIALATSALAAPTLPGINIRWDNCFADGGVMNKSFACDTNTGSDLAVLSIQLDTGMSQVSGMEIRFSLKPAAPMLPAWWSFRNAGSCRANGLCFVLSPEVPVGSCVDWGSGSQNGGIGAYRVDELGPASAVGLIASAVPYPDLRTLDPATEYIVGGLKLLHTQTVGTGACGGCDVPVCILFTSVDVTTPVLANDRLFTQGANGEDSQVIHWQNGQLTGLVNTCTGTFNCNTQFECSLAAASPTATRHNTWGAVKALYR